MARRTPTETDTFAGSADQRAEKSSAPILSQLKKAQDAFREWDATCCLIDDIYSRSGSSYETLLSMYGAGWRDTQLDMFWASFEILKPAVYARPPKPAVKPIFSDGDKIKILTAELLERAATSAFMRTGMGDVMQEVRDDLLFAGRGVPWLRYETDGGQKVCVEHLDRSDFLHEPARKWAEVGWVAGGFWLTREEMGQRFTKRTAEQLDGAQYTLKRDDDPKASGTQKARVWEVWHRADNRTYWVTEGIDVLLDEGAPELKLSGFFPCPRPAYATLKRRSLIPVPDWERYSVHFGKISELTARIYALLDAVRMKGLIPAGGDIGDAIEQLITSDDDQMLVPVPGAALLASGNAANFVQWLPLADIANAITGLITARGQLINDFYELSGISDIMRGATEPEETLGAQQLKSQYGSVRVRGKIDELQRVAADCVKIAAEIIAQRFSTETLLDMAQMAIPTKADLARRVKEIEGAAEKELKTVGQKAQQAMQAPQAQQVDPAQAQQGMQQAQQQVLAKYAPMLQEVQNQVPIEAVMKLLRDDRTRGFAFEVESDSTILTDEMAEKQARGDFLTAFSTASQSLAAVAAMGEQGARLAGEMLKFALAPFRAGRQLDSAIDAFLDAAPQMAAQAQGKQDPMAEANNTLAQAEMVKARAALMGAQSKAELDKADMQRRYAELEQRTQEALMKAQTDNGKLRLQLAGMSQAQDKINSEIDLNRANTAIALQKLGLNIRQQDLDEWQAANEQQRTQVEQQRTAQRDQADDRFRASAEARADRTQEAEPQP